jgi:subtilisin family serine protease
MISPIAATKHRSSRSRQEPHEVRLAYGRSAIDVAAPGGAGMASSPLFTKVWLPCTGTPTATTARPECRNISVPLGRRVAQSVGTSFAAPHVAGLAALLVAQLGHRNPVLIRARILQSADDLGEPGTDPYYGKGRINFARALGIID